MPGCPPKDSDDEPLVEYCVENDLAIITHNFDHFRPAREHLVILGLPAIGIWQHRSDVIVACLGHLVEIHGVNGVVPPEHYMINHYHW